MFFTLITSTFNYFKILTNRNFSRYVNTANDVDNVENRMVFNNARLIFGAKAERNNFILAYPA